MAVREIALEELLGRVVRSAAGRPVGRIEDLRARPQGDEYLVYEVILGELGVMAYLRALAGQLPTLRGLGLSRRFRTRAVPWHWLDLSDPQRPRFRDSSEER